MRKIISLLTVLLAATLCSAAPSTRPTTLPAIPAVASMNDLLRQPPIQLRGWEARVGIADGGRDAGPWKIVYCLASPVRKATAIQGGGYGSCGPLLLDFDRVTNGCPRMAKESVKVTGGILLASRDRKLLFARIIPLTNRGSWEATLALPPTDEEPRPLICSRFEVAENPPLYWQQFAALERYQDDRNDTRFRYTTLESPDAALPQIDGSNDLIPFDCASGARG